MNASIYDHCAGTIAHYINSVRQEDLDKIISTILSKTDEQVSRQEWRLGQALLQVSNVQNLVENPELILGRMDTKHGELAEQYEVAYQNSKSILKGFGKCSTADPSIVGRTVNAPTDYIIRGAHVQSKFINGENNTLKHVINHLNKYQDLHFGMDSSSYYHIPKDQYENILKMIKSGHLDGRNDSSVSAILDKVKQIEQSTGRSFESVVKPAHVKYGEVQWGKIDGTLEKLKFDIEEENSELIDEIHRKSNQDVNKARNEHVPSYQEGLKTAGYSAALGGGLSLISSVYKKYKDGKSIEDYDENDWEEIGLDTAKASIRGGISGASIYGLTNCFGFSAPLAANCVSAVAGISELYIGYQTGDINEDELIEQGSLLCLNCATATLGSMIGQVLIPIPILGPILGSIAAEYCVEILKTYFEKDVSMPQNKFQNELSNLYLKANISTSALNYIRCGNLLDLAMDHDANIDLSLKLSIDMARAAGVEEDHILHNIEEIDSYFLS